MGVTSFWCFPVASWCLSLLNTEALTAASGLLAWLKAIPERMFTGLLEDEWLTLGTNALVYELWQVIIGLFPNTCHPNLPNAPLSKMPTCSRALVDVQCLSLVAVGLSSPFLCEAPGHWLKTVAFSICHNFQSEAFFPHIQKELTLGCLFFSHLKCWCGFHSYKAASF